MERVVEFLQASPVQYLITVGRDGKVKYRLFMFCFEREGKPRSRTSNTKEVYRDMQANPEVEVSISSPEYAWIRFHGRTVPGNSTEIKKGALENPIVKSQYETPKNPIFEVFYLEDAYSLIVDFSGDPPYTF